MHAIGGAEVASVVIMPTVTRETRSPIAGLALTPPVVMPVRAIGILVSPGSQNGRTGENRAAAGRDRAEKDGQSESRENAEVLAKDGGHAGRAVSSLAAVLGICKAGRSPTTAAVIEVSREIAAVTPTVVICLTEGYIVALYRAEMTIAQIG